MSSYILDIQRRVICCREPH